MRIVLQRVSRAKVTVDGRVTGEVGRGLLLLVGFTDGDTDDALAWMAKKVVQLRVFPDDEGKMNRSVEDADGGILVVSQFTLYGDARKGNRPSFIDAARPEVAIPVRALRGAAACHRPPRGHRRVRRDDGRGAGERRPRDAGPGEMIRPRLRRCSGDSPERRAATTLPTSP
jgi:D-tyrosyl-tRNA(Tyr) deacylase